MINIETWIPIVLSGVLSGHASAAWFNIVGDPTKPTEDVVEVDVGTLSPYQSTRTLLIRVNRTTHRTSWDGVAYRSYTAQVLFECTKPSAYYQSITFFKDPLWVGDTTTVQYEKEPRREMQFRAIQPNPSARIVKAACSR